MQCISGPIPHFESFNVSYNDYYAVEKIREPGNEPNLILYTLPTSLPVQNSLFTSVNLLTAKTTEPQ